MPISSTTHEKAGGAIAPVIAIDGPTASGKGTVAHAVAQVLGWQVLDSGALYRLTARAALDEGVDFDDESSLGALARHLDVRFDGDAIWLAGREVAEAIRQEAIGNAASRIASLKQVRAALLERQRAFRRPPGLVADGRDMGTIVFPDANLKIFLVADVRARAERRCKQLIDKGIPANLSDLLRDMRERDARDSERTVAPLRSAEDAQLLDSSELSVEQTVDAILAKWQALNHSKS
jgi:cytidylate kinase